jgi:hypothetical protein
MRTASANICFLQFDLGDFPRSYDWFANQAQFTGSQCHAGDPLFEYPLKDPLAGSNKNSESVDRIVLKWAGVDSDPIFCGAISCSVREFFSLFSFTDHADLFPRDLSLRRTMDHYRP